MRIPICNTLMIVPVLTDHVKQGNNVTIEVIQRSLRAFEENGKTLPPTLYLQLDNTCKQNKSRFLLVRLISALCSNFHLTISLQSNHIRHIWVNWCVMGYLRISMSPFCPLVTRTKTSIRCSGNVTRAPYCHLEHTTHLPYV